MVLEINRIKPQNYTKWTNTHGAPHVFIKALYSKWEINIFVPRASSSELMQFNLILLWWQYKDKMYIMVARKRQAWEVRGIIMVSGTKSSCCGICLYSS